MKIVTLILMASGIIFGGILWFHGFEFLGRGIADAMSIQTQNYYAIGQKVSAFYCILVVIAILFTLKIEKRVISGSQGF